MPCSEINVQNHFFLKFAAITLEAERLFGRNQVVLRSMRDQDRKVPILRSGHCITEVASAHFTNRAHLIPFERKRYGHKCAQRLTIQKDRHLRYVFFSICEQKVGSAEKLRRVGYDLAGRRQACTMQHLKIVGQHNAKALSGQGLFSEIIERRFDPRRDRVRACRTVQHENEPERPCFHGSVLLDKNVLAFNIDNALCVLISAGVPKCGATSAQAENSQCGNTAKKGCGGFCS